jgi:hypothetical protein
MIKKNKNVSLTIFLLGKDKIDGSDLQKVMGSVTAKRLNDLNLLASILLNIDWTESIIDFIST